ncbi:hypothetical protein VTK56DRAFT_8109 [Thermocarpiscus australiensis]
MQGKGKQRQDLPWAELSLCSRGKERRAGQSVMNSLSMQGGGPRCGVFSGTTQYEGTCNPSCKTIIDHQFGRSDLGGFHRKNGKDGKLVQVAGYKNHFASLHLCIALAVGIVQQLLARLLLLKRYYLTGTFWLQRYTVPYLRYTSNGSPEFMQLLLSGLLGNTTDAGCPQACRPEPLDRDQVRLSFHLVVGRHTLAVCLRSPRRSV